MDRKLQSSGSLAAAITKSASKQAYYTIRFFADCDRVADAYRAYAYFRWVDDMIDSEIDSSAERILFANRQKSLLESCYRGEVMQGLRPEECMLVDLVRNDHEKNSGLQMYLRNMMDVMVFDAGRRGRVISQAELTEYTRKLATAATEAIYFFIGHDDPSPCHEARYLAVTAAHITHMLRDTLEDVDNGYFNIPSEVLAVARNFSAGCDERCVPRMGLWTSSIGALLFQSGARMHRTSHRISVAVSRDLHIPHASNGC